MNTLPAIKRNVPENMRINPRRRDLTTRSSCSGALRLHESHHNGWNETVVMLNRMLGCCIDSISLSDCETHRKVPWFNKQRFLLWVWWLFHQSSERLFLLSGNLCSRGAIIGKFLSLHKGDNFLFFCWWASCSADASVYHKLWLEAETFAAFLQCLGSF